MALLRFERLGRVVPLDSAQELLWVQLWAHQPREPVLGGLVGTGFGYAVGKSFKTQSTIGAGSESDRIATAPR